MALKEAGVQATELINKGYSPQDLFYVGGFTADELEEADNIPDAVVHALAASTDLPTVRGGAAAAIVIVILVLLGVGTAVLWRRYQHDAVNFDTPEFAQAVSKHTVHNPGFDAAAAALAIAAAQPVERCLACKAKKSVCVCDVRRTAQDMAAGGNARTRAAAAAAAAEAAAMAAHAAAAASLAAAAAAEAAAAEVAAEEAAAADASSNALAVDGGATAAAAAAAVKAGADAKVATALPTTETPAYDSLASMPTQNPKHVAQYELLDIGSLALPAPFEVSPIQPIKVDTVNNVRLLPQAGGVLGGATKAESGGGERGGDGSDDAGGHPQAIPQQVMAAESAFASPIIPGLETLDAVVKCDSVHAAAVPEYNMASPGGTAEYTFASGGGVAEYAMAMSNGDAAYASLNSNV